MTDIVLDGGPLAAADVVEVAHGGATVVLDGAAADRMAAARDVVRGAVAGGEAVYGVNTGFGALAGHRIDAADAADLQVKLLRSHAVGVGQPLPAHMVRAMLVLRARTLAQGHSGVRAEVVQAIIDLLNRDLLPVVPDRGSVGASGDLAPFAHLALPLIGEGELRDGDIVAPAAEILAAHGLAPLALEPKEGLSLLNGTEGMLAWGILGAHRARRLVQAADLACAMSIEALLGSARPFDARVHALRPHVGQGVVADNLRRLLHGSAITASHRDSDHAVQDAYSLRCAPQVHGAVRDVIDHADRVFATEAGSVVDNPIVFPDEGDLVSGGNFHGQPLAFALDFLAIAATEISDISERRTDRLLDPDRSSGLPAFLAAQPGLESGYMLTQYTSAALVAENRVLSHPASVESIPTSGSQEDHVSMGWGAGRKLAQVLDNAARVVAVEALCAAEGIDYRAPLTPSPAGAAAVAAIRERVPRLTTDRSLAADIEVVAELVQTGALVEAAEAAIGALG
jgi:histidine ammonia-lyase